MAASTSTKQGTLKAILPPAQDPQTEQTRLDMLWEAEQNYSQPFVRYEGTAVLLLYWSESDLNKELRLKQEVKILGSVFRDEYQFEVEEGLLDHEKPQQQMNAILSMFLLNHDKPNRLSIIYYAGHGWSREGNLMLISRADGKTQENLKPYSVAWNSAEKLLKDRQGDAFAIFDCCDAGSLCFSRGPLRFEFLGACCDKQTTKPPGDSSFTTALIWALRQLKNTPRGWFSTPELQKKIKDYKDFPSDQWPHLGHREKESAGLDHVVLAPSAHIIRETGHDPVSPRTRRVDHHFVDLRFHFDRPYSDESFSALSQEIRWLIEQERIDSKRVTFIRKFERLREIVDHWQGLTKRGSRKSLKEAIRAAQDRSETFLPSPSSDMNRKTVSNTSDRETDEPEPSESSKTSASPQLKRRRSQRFASPTSSGQRKCKRPYSEGSCEGRTHGSKRQKT